MGTELHAVFNGHYYDVSVGPHDYSQSVASCHANSSLGYGEEGAGEYARLFAAAPDMIKALRLAREDILSLLNARGCEAEGDESDWVGHIDFAIAKTTQP